MKNGVIKVLGMYLASLTFQLALILLHLQNMQETYYKNT